MSTADTSNVQSPDPARIEKTHAALFAMWFPLEQFPLPPEVKAEIAAIAAKVSAGMQEAFTNTPTLLAILVGMTDPTKLPFYQLIENSSNLAVKAFLAGGGKRVYDVLAGFNVSAGFGVMLVDTPSDDNRITLDGQGNTALTYALSDADKQRFRTGVALGVRMMFLAGADEVIVPSNENLLGEENFDPMRGSILKHITDADLVEKNLEFIPNRTVLTAAHIQAADKIGPSPDIAVVSTRQRVWNVKTRDEVPNLYVMDSSIFPTSVGANPMQSLYTFAKIFSDRLIHGIDTVRHEALRVSANGGAVPIAGLEPAAVVADADG